VRFVVFGADVLVADAFFGTAFFGDGLAFAFPTVFGMAAMLPPVVSGE
jgi:hypothetical protein